jgi:hypothetical protein
VNVYSAAACTVATTSAVEATHDNCLLEFESNFKRLFISFVIAKNRDFDEKYLPTTLLFG